LIAYIFFKVIVLLN